MIGVDWGTTSMRAFRIENGIVLERRDSAQGITHVTPNEFASVLRQAVGDWIADGQRRVLMAGMVGSRQGWLEAPYLDCPAGAAELAAGLVDVVFDGATVAIVPGLRAADPSGVAEVMRGEETQLAGAAEVIAADAIVCLPGTHSKWATIEAGKVTGFTTHMTGEAFAALRSHTILGRMIQDGPTVPEAFARGVDRALEGGGMLHHLFGVRTLGLFGALSEAEAGSYLSGLLIGHEIASSAPAGTVHLIGAPTLCALYAQAFERRGVRASVAPDDLSARGLISIAEHAEWI